MTDEPKSYRPLSVRRRIRPDHALAEGVPSHLSGPLMNWLRRRLTPEHATLFAVRLSVTLPHGFGSATDALLFTCAEDDDLLLDVVDFYLRLFGDHASAMPSLRNLFELAGSAWTVRDNALERRTDETFRQAAGKAVDIGEALANSAGDQLRSAWTAAYGRHPDPSKSLSEAIRSVESAAAPVLCPRDALATLGKMIAQVAREPSRLSLPLAKGATRDPADVVLALMQLLWGAQSDRHGGVDPTEPVTQSQAEAALPAAVALVQLFGSGSVRWT